MADARIPKGYEPVDAPTTSPGKVPAGYEPIASTDAAIAHPVLANAGIYEKPEAADIFRHYVGNPISHSLAAVGASAGALAGEGIGSVPLAAAGSGLGSAIGNKLRTISPRLFGQPSDSPIVDSLQDAAVQGALPEAGGLVLKNVPGVIARVMSKFPAAQRVLEDVKAGKTFQEAKSFLRPSEPVTPNLQKEPLPSQTLTTEDRFANSQINRNMANQGLEPNTTPANMMVRNANRDAVKAAEEANARAAAHTEATTNLFNKGLSESSKTFDAGKVLDELAKNGDKYKDIDPAARKSIDTFLKTAEAQKATAKVSSPALFGYDGKRFLMYGLGGGALGHAVGSYQAGAAAGAAANVAITIANDTIAKKLADPAAAELFTQALKTPLSSPQSTLLGKAALFALRGSEVYATIPGDKPVKMYVNEKGELIPALRH